MDRITFVNAVKGICEKYHKAGGDIEAFNSDITGIVITFTDEGIRKEWIDSAIASMKEEYPNSRVVLNSPERKITVVEFADEDYVYGTGVALCSDTDKFDYKTGIAVAYAKFLEMDIPDFI